MQGNHYVLIPADIIEKIEGFKNTRVMISVNGHPAWHGGIMALGNGNGYISIGKKLLKEFGIQLGSQVQVTFNADESEFGVPICEELQELLDQDEEGARRFGLLKPSVQRYIINYAGAVKSSQLRIDRSIILIGNLKKIPEGKENFRAILGLPPQ